MYWFFSCSIPNSDLLGGVTANSGEAKADLGILDWAA